MPKQLPLGTVALINLRAAGEGKLISMKHAGDTCATIWALAYAHHKLNLGRFPTQAEYAEYWNKSERSAQREWALFRKAFPTEESPERLARWLLSEISTRIEAKQAEAFTVPAPPDLAPPPPKATGYGRPAGHQERPAQFSEETRFSP